MTFAPTLVKRKIVIRYKVIVAKQLNSVKMNAGDIIEDIDDEMPLELLEHAKAAVLELLPEKSAAKYKRVYSLFKDWQKSYGMEAISCDLIMAYFHVLDEEKYKPTSLWAFHSMLKATLKAYENVDIGSYHQVSSFLKVKSSGYKCVKAKVFREVEIQKFIDEAEDLGWLDVKVVLIFGICGACRTDELTRITMDDVERHGDLFLVKINESKTKVSGSFTINGGFAKIVQKYIDLRPSRLETKERFFVNYQRGKCTMQFVGKNKFAQMPRRIAEYLQLPEIERYTGHAFRRTSATILANSGADLETIMRHGRWRNGACARGYIEDSLLYKTRTGALIQSSILGGGSSTAEYVLSPTAASKRLSTLPSTIPFSLAPAVQSTVAVVRPPVAATSTSSVNDSLFDSLIDDDDLIDVLEQVSQTYEIERSVPEITNVAQPGRENQSDGEPRMSLSGLTQSNNSSTLNGVLARTFKSVRFEKIENCTFNFYLCKQ